MKRLCITLSVRNLMYVIDRASYHCTHTQLSMKRTRAALRATPNEDACESKEKSSKSKSGPSKDLESSKPTKIVQLTNLKSEDLKKKLSSRATDNDNRLPQLSSQIPETALEKTGTKLNLKSLKNREKRIEEELKPNVKPPKNRPRAVVNLETMKEELKQLEDPPMSIEEKELSSARLEYSFFDTTCEELAQNLLGKVLVRHLENGTILKGRIVETEGYLGAIDKASHTYQYRITPRNLPMYMQPGTIYVYMTYGMYHCFNISSQEPGSFVRINALEPLIGIDYMELLRNMHLEDNGKYKKIAKNVRRIGRYHLCNSPENVCCALNIDNDQLANKSIYACNDIWVEEVDKSSTTIVAATTSPSLSSADSKVLRYYVLGSPSITHRDLRSEQRDGCAVLIRALEPLEGIEHMTELRSTKGKTNKPTAAAKSLKPHELCNGPSKLCMAYQLEKSHSKYSMCEWRGMWLEDHSLEEEIKVVRSARIGIDSCGPEWASKPLRYYVYGNKCVSKRDKKAEELMGLK